MLAGIDPSIGAGNIRAVGAYRYNESAFQNGMMYTGPLDGTGTYVQIHAPGDGVRAVGDTIPHSTMGTLVVGNFNYQGNQVRGHDVTRVQIGDVIIGIFDASESPCSGVPHHTLRMAWPADQEATCKQLEAAGVPVQGTRGHRNEVGFSICVNDPIGNRLELSFDPPDLPPG